AARKRQFELSRLARGLPAFRGQLRRPGLQLVAGGGFFKMVVRSAAGHGVLASHHTRPSDRANGVITYLYENIASRCDRALRVGRSDLREIRFELDAVRVVPFVLAAVMPPLEQVVQLVG